MKEARIVNWIALVWTVLGAIGLIQDATADIWSFIYMGTIIAAQILALRQLK